MLSLSSQVPDKILFSLSAYSDKTLFSYISTPNGKGRNIIFSPFLGKACILPSQCKMGKGRRWRQQKKEKELYFRQGNEKIILRLMGSCFLFVNKLTFVTLANKLIFPLKKQTIKKSHIHFQERCMRCLEFLFLFLPAFCCYMLLLYLFYCLPSLLEGPELHSLSQHINRSLHLCSVMLLLMVQLLTLSETQSLPPFVCRTNAAMQWVVCGPAQLVN